MPTDAAGKCKGYAFVTVPKEKAISVTARAGLKLLRRTVRITRIVLSNPTSSPPPLPHPPRGTNVGTSPGSRGDARPEANPTSTPTQSSPVPGDAGERRQLLRSALRKTSASEKGHAPARRKATSYSAPETTAGEVRRLRSSEPQNSAAKRFKMLPLSPVRPSEFRLQAAEGKKGRTSAHSTLPAASQRSCKRDRKNTPAVQPLCPKSPPPLNSPRCSNSLAHPSMTRIPQHKVPSENKIDCGDAAAAAATDGCEESSAPAWQESKVLQQGIDVPTKSDREMPFKSFMTSEKAVAAARRISSEVPSKPLHAADQRGSPELAFCDVTPYNPYLYDDNSGPDPELPVVDQESMLEDPELRPMKQGEIGAHCRRAASSASSGSRSDQKDCQDFSPNLTQNWGPPASLPVGPRDEGATGKGMERENEHGGTMALTPREPQEMTPERAEAAAAPGISPAVLAPSKYFRHRYTNESGAGDRNEYPLKENHETHRSENNIIGAKSTEVDPDGFPVGPRKENLLAEQAIQGSEKPRQTSEAMQDIPCSKIQSTDKNPSDNRVDRVLLPTAQQHSPLNDIKTCSRGPISQGGRSSAKPSAATTTDPVLMHHAAVRRSLDFDSGGESQAISQSWPQRDGLPIIRRDDSQATNEPEKDEVWDEVSHAGSHPGYRSTAASRKEPAGCDNAAVGKNYPVDPSGVRETRPVSPSGGGKARSRNYSDTDERLAPECFPWKLLPLEKVEVHGGWGPGTQAAAPSDESHGQSSFEQAAVGVATLPSPSGTVRALETTQSHSYNHSHGQVPEHDSSFKSEVEGQVQRLRTPPSSGSKRTADLASCGVPGAAPAPAPILQTPPGAGTSGDRSCMTPPSTMSATPTKTTTMTKIPSWQREAVGDMDAERKADQSFSGSSTNGTPARETGPRGTVTTPGTLSTKRTHRPRDHHLEASKSGCRQKSPLPKSGAGTPTKTTISPMPTIHERPDFVGAIKLDNPYTLQLPLGEVGESPIRTPPRRRRPQQSPAGGSPKRRSLTPPFPPRVSCEKRGTGEARTPPLPSNDSQSTERKRHCSGAHATHHHQHGLYFDHHHLKPITPQDRTIAKHGSDRDQSSGDATRQRWPQGDGRHLHAAPPSVQDSDPAWAQDGQFSPMSPPPHDGETSHRDDCSTDTASESALPTSAFRHPSARTTGCPPVSSSTSSARAHEALSSSGPDSVRVSGVPPESARFPRDQPRSSPASTKVYGDPPGSSQSSTRVYGDQPNVGPASTKVCGDCPRFDQASTRVYGGQSNSGSASTVVYGDQPNPGPASTKVCGDRPRFDQASTRVYGDQPNSGPASTMVSGDHPRSDPASTTVSRSTASSVAPLSSHNDGKPPSAFGHPSARTTGCPPVSSSTSSARAHGALSSSVPGSARVSGVPLESARFPRDQPRSSPALSKDGLNSGQASARFSGDPPRSSPASTKVYGDPPGSSQSSTRVYGDQPNAGPASTKVCGDCPRFDQDSTRVYGGQSNSGPASTVVYGDQPNLGPASTKVGGDRPRFDQASTRVYGGQPNSRPASTVVYGDQPNLGPASTMVCGDRPRFDQASTRVYGGQSNSGPASTVVYGDQPNPGPASTKVCGDWPRFDQASTRVCGGQPNSHPASAMVYGDQPNPGPASTMLCGDRPRFDQASTRAYGGQPNSGPASTMVSGDHPKSEPVSTRVSKSTASSVASLSSHNDGKPPSSRHPSVKYCPMILKPPQNSPSGAHQWCPPLLRDLPSQTINTQGGLKASDEPEAKRFRSLSGNPVIISTVGETGGGANMASLIGSPPGGPVPAHPRPTRPSAAEITTLLGPHHHHHQQQQQQQQPSVRHPGAPPLDVPLCPPPMAGQHPRPLLSMMLAHTPRGTAPATALAPRQATAGPRAHQHGHDRPPLMEGHCQPAVPRHRPPKQQPDYNNNGKGNRINIGEPRESDRTLGFLTEHMAQLKIPPTNVKSGIPVQSSAPGRKYDMVDVGVILTHPKLRGDMHNVIQRAKDAGVNAMVLLGMSLSQSEEALEMCKLYPGYLYYVAGVHPHYAKQLDGVGMKRLRALAMQPQCVGIGECGLDFCRNFTPKDSQIDVFDKQVALACDLQKPLMVHDREAHVHVTGVLKNYAARLPPVVLHCFTGRKTEGLRYLAMGFYIGVTGYVCKDYSGDGLRSLLSDDEVPLSKLLLETDSPFMYPSLDKSRLTQQHRCRISPECVHAMDRHCRWDRNEPCAMPVVTQIAAACMGLDPAQVADAAARNARQIFRIANINDNNANTLSQA